MIERVRDVEVCFGDEVSKRYIRRAIQFKMMRFVWAICASIALQGAFAQCDELTWRWAYEGGGASAANAILEHINGDVYVGGFSNAFGSNYDFVVTRITSDGQLVWAKRYDVLGDDGGASMYLASGGSGHLYIGGTMGGIGTSSEDGSLIKITEEGEVVWARRLLPMPGYCQVRAIAERPDGGLIVVGSVGSIGAGQTDAYAARFLEDGTLVWLHSYGWPGQDHFTHVELLADGTFIAGCQSMGSGSNIRKGFVAHIDDDGVPIACRLHNGGVHDSYFHATRAENGDYLWVGYTHSYGAGGRDVLATLCDSVGNILWARAYGTPLNEHGLNAVHDVDGGGWMISAFQGTDRIAHVLSISEDGVLNGVRMINDLQTPPSAAWAEVLARTDDGGLLYIGNGATSNIVTQKLNGCAGSGCGSEEVLWSDELVDIPQLEPLLPISATSQNVVEIQPVVYDITANFSSGVELEYCDSCFVAADQSALNACVGLPFVIEPDVTATDPNALIWLWDMGDGANLSSSGVVEYEYEGAGLYNVELVLHDTLSGCADTLLFSVEVFDYILPDIGGDTLVCPGGVVEFEVDTAGSWSVIWPDGTTSSSYITGGPGYVWVVIDNGGCIATDTVLVSLVDLPILDLWNDTTICSGEQVSISVSQDWDEVEWSNGSSNSEIALEEPGQYWVDVIFNGCELSDTVLINVVDLLLVDLGPDLTLCEGDILELSTGLPDSIPHVWSNGTDGSQIEINGSGVIWVEVGIPGCTSVDTVSIVFNLSPIVDLGPDTTLCDTTQWDLSSGYSFGITEWQDGTTGQFHTIYGTGTYSVVVDLNGCIDSASVFVQFASAPELSLPLDTTVCNGSEFVITANSTEAMILWDDGYIGNSYLVSGSGQYIASVANECGNAVDSISVYFGGSQELETHYMICPGGEIALNFSDVLQSIVWGNGGDQLSLTLSAGEYDFVGTDMDGCDIIGVIVVEDDDERGGEVFVPNCFTPNGDGWNEVFRAVGNGEGFAMQVYNRWGRIVHESYDIQTGWDGMVNGLIAPDGVYIYKIQYVDACDGVGRKELIGHLSLMR